MHTPGPYEARPVPDMRCVAIAPVGKAAPFAYVLTPTPHPEPLTQTEYDNAVLLAASDELLKAAKLALDYYRSHGTQKYNPYEVEQTLEKAIAKAEGGI